MKRRVETDSDYRLWSPHTCVSTHPNTHAAPSHVRDKNLPFGKKKWLRVPGLTQVLQASHRERRRKQLQRLSLGGRVGGQDWTKETASLEIVKGAPCHSQ